MKAFRIAYHSILLLVLAVMLTACGGRKKLSSNNLADAGYQLTANDWFRAAADDNPAALEMFIKGGFQINAKTAEGNGALHIAAEAGALKSAKFLLDHQFALDEPGSGGRTPLMESIRAGRFEMMRWLLKQGADPLAKDTEGYKPLMFAVKEGRADAIGDLAIHDREDLDAALLAAALLGQPKVIDELTKYGGSIYARMDDGRTALMVAAENGHAEAVSLLVDIGSNRFTTDPDGHTAADLAAAAGHPDIVKLLSADPSLAELGLQSDEQIGTEMAAAAETAGKNLDSSTVRPLRSVGGGGAPAVPQETLASRSAPPALEGQSLGQDPDTGEVTAESIPSGNAKGTPATVAASVNPIGLVMRSYRQRELPIAITHVEAESAHMQLRGTTTREVSVAQGQTIPGSRLKIVALRRKMHSGKENFGRPTEVSVVELEDSATGVHRELIAGVPASAHDPVALVEDQSTGRRFIASPGQHFTAKDGTHYTISDIRPNQIVVENTATGLTQTLPLRGPRG
jgi:ankyrin repeat protein